MGFFEYLSNNLLYLFLVIGAIVLVIGAGIARYFLVKKWKSVDNAKKVKKSKTEELEETNGLDENKDE